MKARFLSILLVAIISLCANSAAAQLNQGEFSAFGKLGYNSKINTGTAAVGITYALTEELRIAPEIGGIIRNDHQDAFTADLNVHFPFKFSSELVALYPLIGLNYTGWSFHNEHLSLEDWRHKHLGLNVGAGFDLKCTSNIKLFVEAKYCLIKDFSALHVSLGAAYIF